MKLVCYAYKNKDNKLKAPFLEYMESYVVTEKDRNTDKKVKQVINIQAHLEYLLDHQGKYFLPLLVQKYQERQIAILKIKQGDSLVRIAFITTSQHIILLDAIDKPKLYEKGKKKQVNKKINTFLDRMEQYRKDYLKNQQYIPLDI